jgi:murein DD-endopeptidase MepM/ murein hydrolase activator NlpD
MEKKSFTILLTSNRRGRTQSITISAAWLKAIVFLCGVLMVTFGAATVDYVGLLLEAGENKILRAENVQIKRQFQIVESKIGSLENSLERVKSYSTKLRLITSIEDEDRTVKLAVGSEPKPGQSVSEYNEAVQDRGPASEFLVKDSIFMDKPPLDESGGEVTALNQKDYAKLSIRIDRAVKETQLRELGVLQLWESLSERQSLLNATPSIKPSSGWFTSRFGYRIDPFTGKPVMHAGLDIAGPPGTSIVAPADGVVSFVGYESGYGKLVSIDHGYGVVTRFAHNSQIFVEAGQKIKRRDIISAIGSTGRSSGPHCHYEVRVHGVPVDPINYILDEG